MRRRILTYLFFFLAALAMAAASASAWPQPGEWLPLLRGGAIVQDDNTDTNGSRNVVSGPNHAAAYYFKDDAYLYFRLRLDDDPSGSGGGQGLLQSFGWGFELDVNFIAPDYEWLVIVDGIGAESIDLRENTVQGKVNDPSDNSEVLAASIPLAGNYQVNAADTSFNGDQDYFLDWRFPYSTFSQLTGLGPDSVVRFYEGSSSSTRSLTENGADLVGAETLTEGWSDYVTLSGVPPTVGVVKFVEDLAGAGDLTAICPGDVIYVRVDDNDRDYGYAEVNTTIVVLTTPSGDSETLTVSETGIHTGVFTSSIPSASSMPSANNGVLEFIPGQTITATYIDAVSLCPIDGQPLFNQARTDQLVPTPPDVSVVKTVDKNQAVSGDEIKYTLTINNASCGDAYISSIEDVLPAGFTYETGTSAGVTTDDPIVNGQILTWSGSWTVPAFGSVQFSFNALAVGAPGTYYNNASVAGDNFSIVSTGDAAPVTITAPVMEIIKQADKAQAAPNELITYTIHYRNIGDGVATNVIVVDQAPLNTVYEPGTLKIGDAGSNYADAVAKTDLTDGDEASADGGGIVFVIPVVQPDDGAPDSGPDEGRVYFQVRLQ